mgnify:CR=1 FL=1
MDDFISKLVSSGYATYQESNSLLTFNFDDLIEDIIVQIAPKRLNIEDNKFSFFIKK